MSLKKTISTVAALAMSVSAFAGFAVTANAASTGDLYSENFDSTDSYDFESLGNRTQAYIEDATGTYINSGKALHLGSRSSGTNNNLGYKKTLGDLNKQGAFKLEFDVETMSVSDSGNSTIDVAFADTDNNVLFDLNMGTRSNLGMQSVTGAGGSVNLSRQKAVHVSISMNFYNGEQSIELTDLSTSEAIDLNGEAAGTALTGTMTAKNFNGFYYPDTDWKYGYCFIDNITATSIDGSATTITVKDSEGTPIAGASVAVGSFVLTTAADGTAKANLPVGEYTYTASIDDHISESTSLTVTSVEVATNSEVTIADYTVPVPEPVLPTASVSEVAKSTDLSGNAAASYMASFKSNDAFKVTGITWTVTKKNDETKAATVSTNLSSETTIQTDGSIVFGLVIEAGEGENNGLDTIGSVTAELK